MKKSTKIILLAATAMIVLGTGLATLAFAISGGNIGVTWKPGSGFHPRQGFVALGSLESGTQDVEAFTNIRINTDFGSIRLVPSDRYYVEYRYYPTLAPMNITSRDGTLDINYNSSYNGINLFNFQLPKDISHVNFIVYYPRGTELTRMTVATAMGDLSVTDTVFSGDIEFDLSLGSVELENVKAQTAVIDCAMGSVDADNFTAQRLEADLAMGDFDSRSSVLGDTELSLAMGDLALTGDISGNVDLNCSMGNITFETSRPRSDFDLRELSNAGLSNVTVDGESALNKSFANPGAPYWLKANCDLGSISLRFGR